MPERKDIDWSKVEFCEKSDRVISKQLGCSASTVKRYRTAFGIPTFRRTLEIDHVPESERESLSRSDLLIMYGVSVYQTKSLPRRACYRKYIDWDNQPLGKMADTDIADMLNVRKETVSRVRRSRNIAVFTGISKRRNAHKGIDWDSKPLGKVSDSELAKLLDVSCNSVRRARRKRGIAPYMPPKAKGIDWDFVDFDNNTDDYLAEEYSVSASSVRSARAALKRRLNKTTITEPKPIVLTGQEANDFADRILSHMPEYD